MLVCLYTITDIICWDL